LLKSGETVVTPFGRCAIVDVTDADLTNALAALPAVERAHAQQLVGRRHREFVAGRSGSISHKGACAIAIAAPAALGNLGIDMERAIAPRGDIGARILTPREPAVVGKWLTRVFAIKEAVYKAVDPIVRRYVGFQEVEVVGDAVVVVDPKKLPVQIESWCVEHDGYWLAVARAKPR
jgi:4'-phosphopantetheinyl transferase EntD